MDSAHKCRKNCSLIGPYVSPSVGWIVIWSSVQELSLYEEI